MKYNNERVAKAKAFAISGIIHTSIFLLLFFTPVQNSVIKDNTQESLIINIISEPKKIDAPDIQHIEKERVLTPEPIPSKISIPKKIKKIDDENLSAITTQKYENKTIPKGTQAETTTSKETQAETTMSKGTQAETIQIDKDIKLQKEFFGVLKSEIEKNKHYPKSARRKGIEGECEVLFSISKNRTLTHFEMLSGNTIFESSAKKAIEDSLSILTKEYEDLLPQEVTLKMRYFLRD